MVGWATAPREVSLDVNKLPYAVSYILSFRVAGPFPDQPPDENKHILFYATVMRGKLERECLETVGIKASTDTDLRQVMAC